MVDLGGHRVPLGQYPVHSQGEGRHAPLSAPGLILFNARALRQVISAASRVLMVLFGGYSVVVVVLKTGLEVLLD